MPSRSLLTLTAATIFCIAGCNDAAAPSASAPATSEWRLASEPADAVSITQAKSTAEEGADVVITGRIGGRKAPLSSESPVFTIVDLEVPHCGQLEGDRCSTPWDYCCETPEDLGANLATVQIVDATGAALDLNPAAAGLSPLDEVVIVGTVAARPSAEVLTIRATGVYVR